MTSAGPLASLCPRLRVQSRAWRGGYGEEGKACVGPFDPDVLPSCDSLQPRWLVTGPPREAGEQLEAKGRDQGMGFRAWRGRPRDTRRGVTQAVLFRHGAGSVPERAGPPRAAPARCGRVQLLPQHRKQAKFLACRCQLCPGFQVKSGPARGAESGLTGSLGLSHHQHPPRGRDSRPCYLGKESQSHQNAPSSEPPPAPTWPSQSLCFAVGTQPNLDALGWATGGLG